MSFCLQKNHLSPFVIMSFCLQKSLCLRLSLCYSVSKKSSVFIRLYVILSQKNHLSPFVIMSFCLKKTSVFICYYVILSSRIPLSSSVPLLFCLKNFLCLYPSLCYSVLKHSSVFVRLPVILSLIYSVCLMLKCLYKEAYKGPEKRRGICIRSEYVTIMYSVGYR